MPHFHNLVVMFTTFYEPKSPANWLYMKWKDFWSIQE